MKAWLEHARLEHAWLGTALGLGLLAASSTAGASGSDGHDFGDRVEHRLDRKGDRIEQRLDRRGDGIERRLDHRAAQAAGHGHDGRANRLDPKGDRIDARLDRRGDYADARWDRRGDRFDRRWDRRSDSRH